MAAGEKTPHSPQEAKRNFQDLAQNSYIGRIVLGGLDQDAFHLVLGTGITVRSAPNQNRLYERDGLLVRTVAHDPSLLPENTDNILYNAMNESEGVYIATNGKHTDTLVQDLKRMTGHGSGFGDAMRANTFEDDSSSTPRIAIGIDSEKLLLHTGQIYKGDDGKPYHQLESISLNLRTDRGFGFYLRTYEENGDPPESYKGHPLLIPLLGTIDDITATYWEALPKDFRVALAIETVDIADPSKVDFRTVDRFNPQVRAL